MRRSRRSRAPSAPSADVRTDALGNVIARKRGSGDGSQSLMIAAHMDEIGLMVTALDRGFLRFTNVGGIDWQVMPSQEVIVHGRVDLPGLVASRPPHVLPAAERKKPMGKDHLFIDVGLRAEDLAQQVQIGDFISIQRETVKLGEKMATGKAFDNRAGCLCGQRCRLGCGRICRGNGDIRVVRRRVSGCEQRVIGATHIGSQDAALVIDLGPSRQR